MKLINYFFYRYYKMYRYHLKFKNPEGYAASLVSFFQGLYMLSIINYLFYFLKVKFETPSFYTLYFLALPIYWFNYRYYENKDKLREITNRFSHESKLSNKIGLCLIILISITSFFMAIHAIYLFANS